MCPFHSVFNENNNNNKRVERITNFSGKLQKSVQLEPVMVSGWGKHQSSCGDLGIRTALRIVCQEKMWRSLRIDQHVVGISQCHYRGWREDPVSGHILIYHLSFAIFHFSKVRWKWTEEFLTNGLKKKHEKWYEWCQSNDLRQSHAHLIEVQPHKIATNRAPQVPYVVRL